MKSAPHAITSQLSNLMQHIFHEKCLREAKSRKAECPNCRAALSPTQPASPRLDDGDIPQISVDHSSGLREAIRARSAAARDAVRWSLCLIDVILKNNYLIAFSTLEIPRFILSPIDSAMSVGSMKRGVHRSRQRATTMQCHDELMEFHQKYCCGGLGSVPSSLRVTYFFMSLLFYLLYIYCDTCQ